MLVVTDVSAWRAEVIFRVKYLLKIEMNVVMPRSVL